MNERIKQLAEQANIFANTSFIPELTWQEVRDEKFAELIVKDIEQMVLTKKASYNETNEQLKKEPDTESGQVSHLFGRVVELNQMLHEIKKHFGVEQ